MERIKNMGSDEKLIHSVGTAIRSLYQMIVTIDGNTGRCCILDHNPELKSISGNTDDLSKLEDSIYMNIHPIDRAVFQEFTDKDDLKKELERHVFISCECRIRHADGRYYWSELIMCNATEEDRPAGCDLVFLIRDIHRWKTREIREDAKQLMLFEHLRDDYEKLFEENMRDEQTGCYNRKGMKYYTDKVMEEAEKTGKHIFVCVADLNGLKHLNDTYGHAAGDEAIAAVSSELLKAAPGGSRIVRTGGDEFLLLAVLDPDNREPDEMSEKIDAGLKAYNEAHDNPYSVGVSYGWVLLPLKDGMDDLDDYVEMADAKMYEMKRKRDKYRRE
ncbi:MAG: sensor domain-containing diguanylate cyclase [Lachnospiraceae bacterium]|nr:sensor domain-containing diguanylate cyclase [Lachnospiraceae bacterium]